MRCPDQFNFHRALSSLSQNTLSAWLKYPSTFKWMCWVVMVQVMKWSHCHTCCCAIFILLMLTLLLAGASWQTPVQLTPAFPTLLKENPCIEMEIILRLLPLSWKQTNNACKIPKQHLVYLVSALCAEPITGGWVWRVCTLFTNVDGHNAQIKTLMSFVYICLNRLAKLQQVVQSC